MNLLISGLKLPLKLLANLIGSQRKRPKRTELEQKQIKHVRNFAPTHYSWQKRQGKKLTKKQKEYYQKRSKNQKSESKKP